MPQTNFSTTTYKGIEYSLSAINAMCEWINDCQWPDLDDAFELTAIEVLTGINRNYGGGLSQFMLDNALPVTI